MAAAVWQMLLGGSLVPGALARDTNDGTGGVWLRGIVGLGLRTATVAAGASAFGLALAFLGRGTAAAMGVGFGYLLVLENVVGSNFKPLRPWLVFGNALVFVKGQADAGGDVPGRTVIAAGVLLATYAAFVVVLAGSLFRRRDVT